MNKIVKPKIIAKQRIGRGCMILLPILVFFFISNACSSDPSDIAGLVVIYTLIAFIIFGFIYLNVLRLKRLTYTLHDDRITTNYVFLGSYSTTVCYKDIKEISLSQGIFQRKFNVGSIGITTNATKEHGGFDIYNIENYQEIYDFLIKKVAESNNKT